MESKTFFVTALITIAVVSVITSLVSVSLFQNPVLPAFGTGEEGQVSITEAGGDIIDIIIIDDLTEVVPGVFGVSDIITFSAVSRGIWYDTAFAVPPDPLSPTKPRPFVLRNIGNVRLDVDVYSTVSKLFESAQSQVKVWTQSAYPVGTGIDWVGWSSLDNCATGPCYSGEYCTAGTPCNLPYDIDGPGAPPSLPGDLPQNLLTGFEYLDTKDEAFLHVGIQVASDEGTGPKSTIVVVRGFKSA